MKKILLSVLSAALTICLLFNVFGVMAENEAEIILSEEQTELIFENNGTDEESYEDSNEKIDEDVIAEESEDQQISDIVDGETEDVDADELDTQENGQVNVDSADDGEEATEEESEEQTEEATEEEIQQPEADGEDAIDDGNYEIEISSNFKMFVIASQTAVVNNNVITVTLSTASKTYDRIYLGSIDDEDKSDCIRGTENNGGGYDFTFVLAKSLMGSSINFVPGKSDGTWYTKNQYKLSIPETLGKKITEDENEDGEEENAEEDTAEPLADGDYTINVDTGNTMFKVVACTLTAKNGGYTAVITLSGTGYDYLFVGTAAQAAQADSSAMIPFVADAEGKYTYTIPVSSLDKPMSIAAHSISKNQWYDRNLVFDSKTAEKIEAKLDDGTYTAGVETSSKMFKVVACDVTAKDGKYDAVITLSGTGYDKLFKGTAEEAKNASADQMIGYSTNADGQYTYLLTDVKMDTAIAVAAHSVQKDEWYDRTITIISSSLEKQESDDPSDEEDDNKEDENTEEEEKEPEADLNGSTGKVNNSTGIADGTYTPDKFSFSGGTGKVRISCSQVTVTNGKAFATIVFSSPNYSYVKANGQKIYGSHSGSSSTFKIPVRLNANNRIIGMTTAMSVDHEIEYTLYIYLAAAAEAGIEDATAPEVVGLKYKSTDVKENAKLYTIYRYEDGISVISVAGVGSYLIVPENAELPAGIEDELTVIRQPVVSVYAATEDIYDMVIAGGAAEVSVGFDSESETVLNAGSCYSPDYSVLLMSGCELAVMPATYSDARCFNEDTDVAARDDVDDEKISEIKEVMGRMDMLGIALFVDRSTDEENDAAAAEWVKVYGVIFGCEEEANTAYASMIS